MSIRQSSLSLEFVKVPVTQTTGGVAVDLTQFDVEMAFVAEDAESPEPQAGDWKAASWEVAGSKFLARCLVGPGGAAVLTDGEYEIWVRVTTDPEIPIKRVGSLVIE